MASLIIARGPGSGQSFWLGKRVNILGKAQWASMRLADAKVSEEQAKVYYDADSGAFYVCPMDPNNPVYVNGRQIRSDRRLFEDDHILLGNTLLAFTERDFGPSVSVQAAVEPQDGTTDTQDDTSVAQVQAEPEPEGWIFISEAGVVRYERWVGILRRGLDLVGRGTVGLAVV